LSISTVIITKNEALNIAKCIESVLKFSDEIIVVDSYSTDNTKSIATSYDKLKFFERKFDNYIHQKNYANSLASSEFIFSIDADEWCSESMIKVLVDMKLSLSLPMGFKRINIYKNKPIRFGLWKNDWKIRLWKKEIAQWGGATPHEHLIFLEDTEVSYFDSILYHNAYQSHSEFFSKSIQYAKLAAIQIAEKKSFPQLILSLFLNPIYKFIKGYFLRLGFLDGYYGLVIATGNFVETFFKYYLAIHIKWNQQ